MVDGGGFNYGAHVASMMGLKTAAVTRLSMEDIRVVDALVRLGVAVYPTYTSHSTTMTSVLSDFQRGRAHLNGNGNCRGSSRPIKSGI